MKYSERFARALVYAADAHREQFRKPGEIPYVGHLLGVASIVIDADCTEDEAVAALLHDAPEDQGGLRRLEDIRTTFGDRVAEIVLGCSDPLDEHGKDHSMAHDAKKRAYLEHLRQCDDKSVYLLSVADKLHNARATLMDYRSVGHKVWERFNAKSGFDRGAKRDTIVRNYENLITVYQGGPSDNRRDPLVGELKRTIATLRRESEATE